MYSAHQVWRAGVRCGWGQRPSSGVEWHWIIIKPNSVNMYTLPKCAGAYLNWRHCHAALFFQYFKRDADELESWIYEKLQAASDESYKDPTNLQVRMEILFCYSSECTLGCAQILSSAVVEFLWV